MDYTKIPPQLIYKERRNLEDYAINNNLNTIIVDNMVDFGYLQNPNFKIQALKCINAAYYICTLMQAENNPEWSLPNYYNIAYCKEKNNTINQAVTISLVCIYIHWFNKDWLHNHKRLINKLDEYLRAHYIDDNTPFPPDYSYRDTYNMLSQNILENFLMPAEEFSLRRIDKEAIEDLQSSGFTWTKFTDYYTYSIMDDIVFSLGKNADEQLLLHDSFEHDALSFYGDNNDYYQDTISHRLYSLWKNIRSYNHMDDEEDKLRQEIFEYEMSHLPSQTAISPLNSRIAELEKENAELKTKLAHMPVATSHDDGNLMTMSHQLVEKDEYIKELQRRIDDYSARFDPKDLKRKIVLAMTGKQHIILFLSFLAHHDRLPNSRKTMSSIMSFIASRNESTMEDYLGDAISKEECENLAKVFDNEKQFFIAGLIRELPEKLEKDKKEKNRTKALKKTND